MAVPPLLKKRLIRVALERIARCPGATPAAEELRKTGLEIRQLPQETRDWAKTDDRFQINLEAPRSRSKTDAVLADERVTAWAQMPDDVTLHEANDGNRRVRGTVFGDQRTWIPAALDFCGWAEMPAMPRCGRTASSPRF